MRALFVSSLTFAETKHALSLRCSGLSRMPFALFAVIIAAFFFPLAAQVVVEDEDVVVTDVVNVFDVKAEKQRSVTAAMGMSLALPGAGHYYLDRRIGAYVYLAIDAASLFGAIMFNSYANQREAEARSFAAMAAGIERAPSGDAYWRHVGAFMDAAEYNEAVELSRGSESDLYADPETWWRWGDESQKDAYNGIRQKARDLRVVSSFFIGAMVANRLVSAIELRVYGKKKRTSVMRFEPALAPDLNGASVALRVGF